MSCYVLPLPLCTVISCLKSVLHSSPVGRTDTRQFHSQPSLAENRCSLNIGVAVLNVTHHFMSQRKLLLILFYFKIAGIVSLLNLFSFYKRQRDSSIQKFPILLTHFPNAYIGWFGAPLETGTCSGSPVRVAGTVPSFGSSAA